MKYIIAIPVGGVLPGMPLPFFCVAPMLHSELAGMVRRQGYGGPVSAGFVTFNARGEVRVTGRSDSLNLSPGSDDAEIIRAHYRQTLAQAGVTFAAPAGEGRADA